MGGRGRYGKYGETKRLARLREAGPKQVRASESADTAFLRRGQRYRKPPLARSIQTRSAGEHDVRFIQELSKQAFGRYGPYDETLVHWHLSDVADTLLATIDNRPVGFAMLERSFRNKTVPRVCELLAIAVKPDDRRCGVGRLLLNEIDAKARALQAQILVLHTAVDNMPAQALFMGHGFKASKTRPCFYPKGQDAVMMVRNLV